MKLAFFLALGILIGTGALGASKALPQGGVHTANDPIPLCPPDNPNCGLNN